MLQAALTDTSIPSVEVQAAEDPTDEPELEVLDDNAVKLDTSNVPIMLSVSQVHEFAMSCPLTQPSTAKVLVHGAASCQCVHVTLEA